MNIKLKAVTIGDINGIGIHLLIKLWKYKKKEIGNFILVTNYNLFIEKWRQDWESLDVNLYLRHYSKEYIGLGKDYNSWVEYKRRVIPMKKYIKVNLTNKSVFLYPDNPDLMVVTFLQDYASDTFRRKFTKRQYWRMEDDGKWRIIYEGAAS